MTLREALEKGYRETDPKKAAGYVSRRKTWEDALSDDLKWAKNKKAYYYEMPLYYSTRYCLRIYLVKEVDTEHV